jgi:hypothetical protein
MRAAVRPGAGLSGHRFRWRRVGRACSWGNGASFLPAGASSPATWRSITLAPIRVLKWHPPEHRGPPPQGAMSPRIASPAAERMGPDAPLHADGSQDARVEIDANRLATDATGSHSAMSPPPENLASDFRPTGGLEEKTSRPPLADAKDGWWCVKVSLGHAGRGRRCGVRMPLRPASSVPWIGVAFAAEAESASISLGDRCTVKTWDRFEGPVAIDPRFARIRNSLTVSRRIAWHSRVGPAR